METDAVNAPPSNAVPTDHARPPIRLRVLLAILLLSSPFGAWNLWAFGTVMRAHYAVSRIESLGGQVLLSAKAADLMIDPTALDESVVLGWHRFAFGETSAASVSFSGLPIVDADLSCLDGFQKVYAVTLDNTPITDAGLDFLKGHTELRGVSVEGTAITDAGIKKLEGLTNLCNLRLCGTKITDAGLESLEGLNMLTALNLSRTHVTDAGLKHVEKIPNLQVIEIDETDASGAECDRLKKLCTSRIPPDYD